MPWFRRRKNESDVAAAPQPAARVHETRPETPVARPAAASGAATDSTTDPNRPKRRRGSRGGRGRKKPGTAGAATAASATPTTTGAEKAERPPQKRSGGRNPNPENTAKTERKQPEKRQLSQRQERRRSEGASSSRRRQPPRRAPLPAAKRELLVSVDVGEQRVAVLEDDQVAEVYLERPDKRSIAGNIYLGQVDNVLPGMEAAFVEIGLEKNGFLYVDEIVGPELERGHGRKIQDLINKGQTILVQAVKDPMKTKGARLTTQISLPGRFVVFVPQGEGLGVSRRLDDDERQRLKDILKKLALKEGGLIVRTAAEGASEEDIERDLVFLQRLWKSIQAKAEQATAPELIYQEAELPLRVTRDLFTGDFEKAYVDNDQAFKRITGYLKKTSPHMVERVVRYKETPPLMEAFGVEQEIKSTLSRRVDLPSGGYLIFDYAEAFTVIDVNTGRFVGGRGKNSGGRLEDTITKNNLEAVKEVVRQLRLRDIGGIIVIDFIDMANPKNRAAVEEALRNELERDRTKTYVVEISPLGLVEMTRQNVTDGPREIMTRKCPTCGGDGIVYSEASAAIDVERRLRSLAAGSKSQAFRVEVSAPIASALIGPGARRLIELEALTKRRFFFEGKQGTHTDHFVVLAEGKLADLAPQSPVEEGVELTIELVEVDRHDGAAAVGKLEGFDVCVGEAAEPRRQEGQGARRARARRRCVRDARAPREEGAGAADRRGGGREADAQAARAQDRGHRRGGRRCRRRRRRGRARRDRRGRGSRTEGSRTEVPAPKAAPNVAAPRLRQTSQRRRPQSRKRMPTRTTRPLPTSRRPPRARLWPARRSKKTRRGSRGGKNRKRPAGANAAAGTGASAVAGEPTAETDGAEPALRPWTSRRRCARPRPARRRRRARRAASRSTCPPPPSAATATTARKPPVRSRLRAPSRRPRAPTRQSPMERRPRRRRRAAAHAAARTASGPQAQAPELLQTAPSRTPPTRPSPSSRSRPSTSPSPSPSLRRTASPVPSPRRCLGPSSTSPSRRTSPSPQPRPQSPSRRPSRPRPPTASGATCRCRSGAMTSTRAGSAGRAGHTAYRSEGVSLHFRSIRGPLCPRFPRL